MPRTGLYVALDAHYQDDPKMMDLPVEAELVYIRALTLSKRTKSDGFIDQRQIRRLSEGFENHDIAPAALLAAGLWISTEGGYSIVAWRKHNIAANDPTNAERQQRYRANQRNGDEGIDNALRETRNARYVTPREENRTEEIEKTTPPTPPVDNSGGGEHTGRGGRVDEALKIITLRERDIAGANIRHPAAWARAVIERNRIDHGPTFNRLADEHPEWTADQLADSLNPAPVVVERPLCATCHRHTLGLYECPTARDNCPTAFVLQVLA